MATPHGLTHAEQMREWAAVPPPDHEKPVDPNAPKCASCGRYHGPVGELIRCLTDGITKRDTTIVGLQKELARYR